MERISNKNLKSVEWFQNREKLGKHDLHDLQQAKYEIEWHFFTHLHD